MSSYIGQMAEAAGADYLMGLGWQVIDKNWRNRWCEIDIVASSGSTPAILHFVEVKYRKSTQYGLALEYVTATKLKQMKLAARHWAHENNWAGDYRIDALAITGSVDDWNIELVENLTG